jgi:hypothetical protein
MGNVYNLECRIVMIAVLIVMNGVDPHTIRVTWIGMVRRFGFGQYGLLDRAAIVDSVVCSMSHFEEKRC